MLEFRVEHVYNIREVGPLPTFSSQPGLDSCHDAKPNICCNVAIAVKGTARWEKEKVTSFVLSLYKEATHTPTTSPLKPSPFSLLSSTAVAYPSESCHYDTSTTDSTPSPEPSDHTIPASS